MNILHLCPPHLSDVLVEIQKKSFLTVLFIHTSDLSYLRRKQIATVVLQLNCLITVFGASYY